MYFIEYGNSWYHRMYLKEYVNFHNMLKSIWLEIDQMSFHLTQSVNRKWEWGLGCQKGLIRGWVDLKWVHSLIFEHKSSGEKTLGFSLLSFFHSSSSSIEAWCDSSEERATSSSSSFVWFSLELELEKALKVLSFKLPVNCYFYRSFKSYGMFGVVLAQRIHWNSNRW